MPKPLASVGNALKWAPYNSKASIYLRALFSSTLSLPPAHLFKINLWAVLKFGRDVFSLLFPVAVLTTASCTASIMTHHVNQGCHCHSYIPSFFLQEVHLWHCYSVVGWGRWLLTWLLQFTHGHLYFLLVFCGGLPGWWTISWASQRRISLRTCFLVSFCSAKQSDSDTYSMVNYGDGHSGLSARLLNYADLVQLHNLGQALHRQINFRNPLCFKKLTCAPTQNITIRVVILKLGIHEIGVKVERNPIAKWEHENRFALLIWVWTQKKWSPQ